MLSEFLGDRIKIVNNVKNWEASIKVAAQPLLLQQYITEEYVEEMIQNVHVNGSYIVVVPEIALAHAQSQYGVLKPGLSLLKLDKAVVFPESKLVKLVIVLAAQDSEKHLELMSQLAEILVDENVKMGLKNAKKIEDMLNLIKIAE